MSLFRHSARRSMNVALAQNTSQLPILSRAFANSTAREANQLSQRDERPPSKDKTVIKHAPGWKHENASDSEASVKADREPHAPNVKHLQNETVDHLHGDGDTLLHDLKEKAQAVGYNVAQAGKEYAHKAQDMGENLSQSGQKYLNQTKEEVQHLSEKTSNQSQEVAQKVKTEAGKVTEKDISREGRKLADQVKNEAENVKISGKGYVDRAKTEVKEIRDKSLSPESKDYAFKVEQEAKQTGDSVLDGVKAGAQKMSSMLKGSMETAKKAVGMDGNSNSNSNNNNNSNGNYKGM
ncbi:hypothetical protein BGZ83_011507 [Gryganskiella cystojenkinii]|nr:hypothetical protein BGZ83_011507 [Gryganskiella cystojenkinii]